MRKYFIFALLVAMFISFIYLLFQEVQREDFGDLEVFCSPDVIECPDGGFVGRIPPECEFAKCSDSGAVEDANTELVYFPMDDFLDQVTKKKFGIYITPETSPVQPERFSGFHTGVDVEVQDPEEEIAIYAITDGTVMMKQFVSGYGGLLVLKHEFPGGLKIFGIYGHLKLDAISASLGSSVYAGEMLGVLGEAESEETDGERKHLHFGLVKDLGVGIDVRGYVSSASVLEMWMDPVEFLKERKAEVQDSN